MAFTKLFENHSLKAAARSVLEGTVIVCVAIISFRVFLDDVHFVSVFMGLMVAWGAASVSIVGLHIARGKSFKSFSVLFVSGIIVRILGLALLMTLAWDQPGDKQSYLLISYILGVIVLFLLEYRPLYKLI